MNLTADISKISDNQAEAGVIATLVYHPEFILHTDYLKPSYFYNVENGCIYWAIQELYKNGIETIDAINITNMLNSNKAVKKTIEQYNLSNIQEFISMSQYACRHSLEEYKLLVNNVVTMSFKRDLNKIAMEIQANCLNSETDLKAGIDCYKQAIPNHTITSRYAIPIWKAFGIDVENGYGLSDKIPYEQNDVDKLHFKIGDQRNVCFIYVPISELKTDDDAGFVEWAKNKNFKMILKRTTPTTKTVDLTTVNQDGNETKLGTFDDTTHVLLQSEGVPIQKASLTVKTKIPSASSTSLLMDDISTNQQQLETTVDEQSNNVDATMIATTEIYEETL